VLMETGAEGPGSKQADDANTNNARCVGFIEGCLGSDSVGPAAM
jgi:hypothetical protein